MTLGDLPHYTPEVARAELFPPSPLFFGGVGVRDPVSIIVLSIKLCLSLFFLDARSQLTDLFSRQEKRKKIVQQAYNIKGYSDLKSFAFFVRFLQIFTIKILYNTYIIVDLLLYMYYDCFIENEVKKMVEKMKSFSMLLSDELKTKLQKKARENGQTLSAYIRLVLAANVKDVKK